MGEKKIIVEQNGQQKEVDKKKLEEIQSNPDYQVEKTKEESDKDTYKVKERLFD